MQMDSYKDKTVMVVSPHADDAAAFCGGTLARLAGQGADLELVALDAPVREPFVEQ